MLIFKKEKIIIIKTVRVVLTTIGKVRKFIEKCKIIKHDLPLEIKGRF